MTAGAHEHYVLVIRGEIGDHFGVLFEGMRITRSHGTTLLTGPVRDQAHLHGLIERISELGIELVSVNPIDERHDPMSSSSAPDTIVLVHGFWVTPRSWEDWKAHYEGRGFTVIAPAYPGFEVEVEALNADPTPIEKVTFPEVIAHFESVIDALDRPPIIIGHSAGGAITQVLLDHGRGAAGVALNSAPTEGVRAVPLSQIRSTFEVLKNPANRHRAVGLSPEQWHYAFTNGFSEEESRRLYERYHVPASGGILWNSVLANIQPGHQDTWVDYSNEDRAPLLFISGSTDHIMPPSVQRSNHKHYKGTTTITEITEFEGPHLMIAAEGWERIADHALDWALEHAEQKTPA